MTPDDEPIGETPFESGATPATLDLSRAGAPARPIPRPISTSPVDATEGRERAVSANLLHVWNILIKWRWPITAVTLLGIAAGAAATVLTTPIYQATATIQIDTEPAKPQVSTQSVFAFDDPEKYYLTQYELLKSRTLAERVARSEDSADDQSFLHPSMRRPFWRKAPPRPAPSTYAARTSAAASRVVDGLGIDPIRASRLVKISFQSPDPGTAARLANAVAASFISWNLERRYQASADARKFLEDRLQQTRAALESSQEKGNAYAQSNRLITVAGAVSTDPSKPETGESIDAADLSAMDQALSAATAARIQAEAHWHEAQTTPDSALPEILGDASYQNIRAARDAALADYQQNSRLYRPGFPTMVDAKAKIDTLDKQLAALSASIRAAITTQYQLAVKNENALKGQVGARKSELLASQAKRVGQGFINTDINTSQTLYDSMLASYKQIGISDAIEDNNISFVDKALTPHSPIKPQPFHNLVLFGAIGLALGVMLAFLLEQFDLSIKVPEDVERELGIPVLATIPVLTSNTSAAKALENPRSQLSEGYYSARAALQLATENGVPGTLLVTSSMMGEGKSTSALALASGFGRLGMRVLLIDADMRNPVQHRLLGRDNSVGLSSVLAGGIEARPAFQPTSYSNLTFLAAGRPPPNPSELLAGGRMLSFLQAAREHFDVVVIDSPPVMGLADAPQLANISEGVLLVVEANATKRDIAKGALRRLRATHAHMVGALFTKFDIKKAGYAYGYAYSYGYGRGYGFDYGSAPKKMTVGDRIAGLLTLGHPSSARRDK